MDLKNRLGRFLTFAGVISLFVFFASLYTPDKDFNYWAFIVGVLLISVSWPMRRAKRAAPPPKPAAPPSPKPAARPAGPAPKKPGLLNTILKGPPPKKPAAPPPPQPPPPPPKKTGLAALFSPKPKKK